MDLKKTIAFISALAVSGSALVSNGISAFADEDERQFETGSLPTFIYTMDNQTEINCRIYEDMPSIPYIRFSDYYKCWTEQDAEIVNNGDGTYTVTVPTGAKAVIDVNKDTLSTDEFAYFTGVQSEIEGTDDMLNIFVKDVQSEAVEYDEKPVTIDFSSYNIDITGDENDIWFPAPTLCDIFKGDIYTAVYYGGTLLFGNDALMAKTVSEIVEVPDYFELYAENGRPQDLAEYNYNELCLVFDLEYGYPGRMPLEDVLREKGLDGMLSESNADTQLVKKHLLSSDPYEYSAGLLELGYYTDDGGHTAFGLSGDITEDMIADIYSYMQEDYEGLSWTPMAFLEAQASSMGVFMGRNELFENADPNKSVIDIDEYGDVNTFYYAVNGDTAVFGFDSFESSLEEWSDYYINGGEMPEDIVSIFYNCVTMANEDPEIKNFVIDLGANTGGLVAIECYMMNLIADMNSTSMRDERNDITNTGYFEADRNLDGVYDEKDKDVKFDLNFAVISSQISFSCGNLMVSDAKENGILVIGEQSGGGACAVKLYMLPDGQLYTISSVNKLVNCNGESIDAGIIPDFITTEKAVIDFMGQPMEINDFTSAYSFEGLSEMCAEFYSNETATGMLGDVTGDGIIDATDASAILTAYAEESVGKISGFTKEQKNLADVNNDGIFDAVDASAVLTFYAKSSAGYTGTFEEFLAEQAA